MRWDKERRMDEKMWAVRRVGAENGESGLERVFIDCAVDLAIWRGVCSVIVW